MGSISIPELWNLSPFLSVVFFALMALFLFYLIDRAGLHRSEKAHAGHDPRTKHQSASSD